VTVVPEADRRYTPGTRGRTRLVWDALFRVLRIIASRAQGVYTVFGIFLVSGAVVASAGTWVFSELAGHVRSGSTLAFDTAVMTWIGEHQDPSVQAAMLEITSLGTGLVVAMIVVIAAMFLWLNRHKHSA